MLKKITIPNVLFCILSVQQAQAIQREELTLGTRAMGMAGIFEPQSDDSSGVLYNPAGLAIAQISDFTIGQSTVDAANDVSQPNLIALSAYNNFTESAFSVAYANKLQKTVATTPEVDINSQGLYIGIGKKYSKNIALGISYSYVTNSSDKQGTNEEVGFLAMKLGFIGKAIQSKYLHASIAGSYQLMMSNDSLDSNTMNSALIIEPQGYNLGANIKLPTPYFLLSLNYSTAEYTYDYDIGASDLPSKKNEGYSAELHIPVWNKFTASFRMGHREDTWSDLSEKIVTNATGFGISYANTHFIDMANEIRDAGGNSKTLNYTSLSYAYQF